MRVTGQIIGVDPYAGKFTSDTGELLPYSGQKLSVLDGREVIKVKVKQREVPLLGGLSRGDDVDCLVDVVAVGAPTGAYLTVTFVELVKAAPAHLASVAKSS